MLTFTIVTYFNNIYVLSPESTPLLPAIARVFKDSPMSLNLTKSLESEVSKLKLTGLKALGTYIGPLRLRRQFLKGKIDKLQAVVSTLRDFPKQHALLLFKGSSQLLFRHLQR